MAISSDFKAYVEELFAPLGPITIKRMFGGAGVYAGEVMFALVSDDELYLKVDAESEAQFRAAGSRPFIYSGHDGQEIALGYWRAPDAAMESPDDAEPWGRMALDAAMRKRAGKAKKRPRLA
jgi:DNA transformation protein